MPTFNGKFRYGNTASAGEQARSCRVVFDTQNLQLIPDTGTPLAIDLGDIDEYIPGDYQLSLRIYDGTLIVLSHFGKTLQNLAHDLLEAYRHRTIQCLLLEDLEEVVRVDGFVQFGSPERQFSSRSELRLYRSNLAILPEGAAGLQWRLADIDALDFDEANHAVNLRCGNERIVLSKLAKRTGEFSTCLKSAMGDVTEQAAKIVQRIFPFLTPDQFQKAAALMKEGRAADIAALESVNPKTGQALILHTVHPKLKPYFDFLRRNAMEQLMYAGFKLIRKEAEEEEMAASGSAGEAAQIEEAESQDFDVAKEAEPVLHWYFFPLRNAHGGMANVAAWEAVSTSGRATYFFRLVPKENAAVLQDPSKAGGVVDASIRHLNQALVLLNFRREPIYLPDESLEMQGRYRRYAIACRKLPVLRQLRAAFMGRALHTSPEDWEAQVRRILSMEQD